MDSPGLALLPLLSAGSAAGACSGHAAHRPPVGASLLGAIALWGLQGCRYPRAATLLCYAVRTPHRISCRAVHAERCARSGRRALTWLPQSSARRSPCRQEERQCEPQHQALSPGEAQPQRVRQHAGGLRTQPHRVRQHASRPLTQPSSVGARRSHQPGSAGSASAARQRRLTRSWWAACPAPGTEHTLHAQPGRPEVFGLGVVYNSQMQPPTPPPLRVHLHRRQAAGSRQCCLRIADHLSYAPRPPTHLWRTPRRSAWRPGRPPAPRAPASCPGLPPPAGRGSSPPARPWTPGRRTGAGRPARPPPRPAGTAWWGDGTTCGPIRGLIGAARLLGLERATASRARACEMKDDRPAAHALPPSDEGFHAHCKRLHSLNDLC